MSPIKSLLVALLVLSVAVPAGAGTWPHERDGFVIGFNLGGGSATYQPDVGDEDSGGGGAGSFRLGWGLANRFLVGLESTAWIGDTDLGGDLTLSSMKLNFTWYPAARGWFVRAGFGGGTAELTGKVGGRTVSVSDNGGTFGFGAGHEWRLTRTFALGAALDYCTVDLDLEKFFFTNFTAQLNWYF
jgi:hypothetical protein